jgi:hypothetical protein
METTHRFRLLIYLAAFMLAMSLCFAYAEPLPSANPLLFQVTPQHSGFLGPLQSEPTLDATSLRAASPVVSSWMLEQFEPKKARHGLFHHERRSFPGFVLVNVPDEASVLVLTFQPSGKSRNH